MRLSVCVCVCVCVCVYFQNTKWAWLLFAQGGHQEGTAFIGKPLFSENSVKSLGGFYLLGVQQVKTKDDPHVVFTMVSDPFQCMYIVVDNFPDSLAAMHTVKSINCCGEVSSS